MWRVEPGADPDPRRAARACAREDARRRPAAGTARRRPGSKPVMSAHAVGERDLALRQRRARRAIFAGVGAAVSGHEREHRPAVALEDERLHDLSEVAADGARGVGAVGVAGGELLDPDLGAGLAEERRYPLDRLGPSGSAVTRVGERG